MKKLLFVISLFVCSIATAQEKVDFFKFIDQIDWNSTRDEFIEKHRDMIIPDSLAVGRIYLKSLTIGGITGIGVVSEFDSETSKPSMITIVYGNEPETENLKQWNYQFRQCLKRNFGDPVEKRVNEPFEATTDYYFSKKHLILHISPVESNMEIIGLCPPSPQYEKDFRVANWGDSMSVIKNLEGKPNMFGDENSVYAFEDYLGDIQCHIAYAFRNGRLTHGKYVFRHIPDDKAIYQYERLQKMLDKKYGRVSWDYSEWKDVKYEEIYKDKEVEAIKKGYRTKVKCWCNGPTFVVLGFRKSDTVAGDWLLILEYMGREMLKEQDQAILDAL